MVIRFNNNEIRRVGSMMEDVPDVMDVCTELVLSDDEVAGLLITH